MFMAAKEFPLPVEYRFLPLEEVFHEPPADMADRTAIFLDCGNIDRMPVDFLSRRRRRDHQHRPPPRQHPFRRPQPGRRRRLLHRRDRLRAGACCSGREITPEMASALYVGLITDTGKFMYENTNARTHRIAADLIEAGVAVDDTYRRLYEHVPIEKIRLSPAPSTGSSAMRRAPRPRLHHRRRLRGDRGRGGDDRGHHRPPALGRGSPDRRPDPRPRRPRPGRPQGQPALEQRRGRRLRDRPQERRRRAQTRRRLLDRPRARRAGRRSSAARSATSSD